MSDYRQMTIDEAMEDESFIIDCDSKAEWALRKIDAEKKEFGRIFNEANEEILYYEDVQKEAQHRFDSKTSYLKGLLNSYFNSVEHKDTKTQETYKLPSGTLVMKKAKLDLDHDDEALLAYLEGSGNTEYIKVTRKPAWAELKKVLTVVDGNVIDTTTGDVVAGVSIVEKPESFEVKL